jgi:ankyrin repeat protein
MRSTIVTSLFAMLVGATASAAPADRQLFDAAKANNPAAVRALLNKGADVNMAGPDGSTALLWTTYHNDLDTVRLLIAAGADVNTPNEYAETPLSLACQNRNAPLVEILLAAGARATTVKPSGETVLMTAARVGNVEIVGMLLNRGAPVNAREATLDQTALMWAAAHRHSAVVQALIEAGAEVNARSKRGATALHFAVQQNDVATAKILLAAGADINAEMTVRQIDGFTLGLVETLEKLTPMLLAITDCRQDGPEYNGSTVPHPLLQACPPSEELAILFLENGADANGSDGSQIPALHQAVHAGMLNLVKALLAHGADVNRRVPKTARQWTGPNRNGARAIAPIPAGATPFYIAAWWNNPEIMRTLLAAGADPRIPAEDETNALMAAVGVSGRPPMGYSRQINAANMIEAVEISLDRGLDINASNGLGQTAMHGAAKLRSKELIQYLAEHGANVRVRDKEGQTPLRLAERAEYMVDTEAVKNVTQLLRDLEQQQGR